MEKIKWRCTYYCYWLCPRNLIICCIRWSWRSWSCIVLWQTLRCYAIRRWKLYSQKIWGSTKIHVREDRQIIDYSCWKESIRENRKRACSTRRFPRPRLCVLGRLYCKCSINYTNDCVLCKCGRFTLCCKFKRVGHWTIWRSQTWFTWMKIFRDQTSNKIVKSKHHLLGKHFMILFT